VVLAEPVAVPAAAERRSAAAALALRAPRTAVALEPLKSVSTYAGVARRGAALRLPRRASIVFATGKSPSAPGRAVPSAAKANPEARTGTAALLVLSARANKPRRDAAAANAGGPLPSIPAPTLTFRRSSPAAAPAPPPEPRAASQPPAAAIDVEALSRDVIHRIEKRLRIERERHGRI
jgi:hypothetical protein